MRKIEGSLKASTAIMKNVNSMVRLQELTATMQQVSRELMKAGIIEEMVSDTIAADELVGVDPATENDIEKVISDALTGRPSKSRVTEKKPQQLPQQPVQAEVEEEDSATREESLADMRGRLEALKS